MVSPQKTGVSKTNFRQTHYMTFAGSGKAATRKGHIVSLALRLLGFPRIIETIHGRDYNFTSPESS